MWRCHSGARSKLRNPPRTGVDATTAAGWGGMWPVPHPVSLRSTTLPGGAGLEQHHAL